MLMSSILAALVLGSLGRHTSQKPRHLTSEAEIGMAEEQQVSSAGRPPLPTHQGALVHLVTAGPLNGALTAAAGIVSCISYVVDV